MNRSHALGLVIGLAAGLLGGALIAKNRKPAETPPASRPVTVAPPPAPPPPTVAPAPDPEVDKLRAEVADLKERLAAKAKTEPAPKSEAAETPKSGLQEKLEAFLKKGLQGYKAPGFAELVQELKKMGKEGIDLLAAKLLHSESAGERFLAGALLEDIDDPSAIPFLAQSLQKDDDELVRRMSSHAIAMIENEAGLEALRAAMSGDSDWGVRVNSAYGVAKLGQADGIKMLENAYLSASTPVEYKLNVLGGLADIASPSSAPVFKKVLSESTDITALYITIGAVEKLKDASFLPELNRIAADAKYSTNVRELAKKAADSLAK